MPCFYCGVKFRKRGIFLKTKDHVIPKSKGGTKTVFACLKCNHAKANMSIEEFRFLRGGVEFYGEMIARQEQEKTDWIYSFSHVDPKQVPAPPPKKYVVPTLTGLRPVYAPSIDLSKIRQYTLGAKIKKKKSAKVPDLRYMGSMPDLIGRKFGALIVVRRIIGKWEAQCICGVSVHRSGKAVCNPKNSWDACDACRKIIGKLRSDIFHETGIEVDWQDCFDHIFGPFLGDGQEDPCLNNGEPVGIADVNSFAVEKIIPDNEQSIT